MISITFPGQNVILGDAFNAFHSLDLVWFGFVSVGFLFFPSEHRILFFRDVFRVIKYLFQNHAWLGWTHEVFKFWLFLRVNKEPPTKAGHEVFWKTKGALLCNTCTALTFSLTCRGFRLEIMNIKSISCALQVGLRFSPDHKDIAFILSGFKGLLSTQFQRYQIRCTTATDTSLEWRA